MVQFAIVKSKYDKITCDDLPQEIEGVSQVYVKRGPFKKLDVDRVKVTIVKTGGNKATAARYLGVGRATLYRFIEDYPEPLEENVLA